MKKFHNMLPLFLAASVLPSGVEAEPPSSSKAQDSIAITIRDSFKSIDQYEKAFLRLFTQPHRTIDITTNTTHIEILLKTPVSDIPIDEKNLKRRLAFFRTYLSFLDENIKQAKRTRKKLKHAVTKLVKYLNDEERLKRLGP
ncbi:MAG: hypothetical protein N0E59_02345 [Candidatus Thiodiazotropha taylori]|nr:hypothetical protein [Candidatus Thiodiazotropha taylori]MCW4281924.1 hypothetical protein [Candidatus Thiodiazotropha taylori]